MALFVACQYGQAENVTLLLNCDNIKTDHVDWNGRTLAHMACQYGHVSCLRVLVEYDLLKFDAIESNSYNPIERANLIVLDMLLRTSSLLNRNFILEANMVSNLYVDALRLHVATELLKSLLFVPNI